MFIVIQSTANEREMLAWEIVPTDITNPAIPALTLKIPS